MLLRRLPGSLFRGSRLLRMRTVVFCRLEILRCCTFGNSPGNNLHQMSDSFIDRFFAKIVYSNIHHLTFLRCPTISCLSQYCSYSFTKTSRIPDRFNAGPVVVASEIPKVFSRFCLKSPIFPLLGCNSFAPAECGGNNSPKTPTIAS